MLTREGVDKKISYNRLLEYILNSLYMGIIVVDFNSRIIYYNQYLIDILKYTNYLNIYDDYMYEPSKHGLLNKKIQDVFPKSRLPKIIKTGKPEIGEVREVNDQYYITSRFPLVDEKGAVRGALAKIYIKDFDEIKELANKIEELNEKLSYYKRELNRKNTNKIGLEKITSRNKQMIDIKKTVFAAANGKSTILITGESGTGKDFLAEAIHQSSRSDKPYIALNCATIQENLLEAELFGYSAGSFTGAIKGGKMGKIEAAREGTLFLDEIGDMSYQLQAKLLRFLQNRTFYRVGGDKPVTVDVRIIAATNQDLEQMVENNKFREDLYYRLNVIRIKMPPLRERKEDLELLIEFFINKYNKILNCAVLNVSPEAYAALKNYHWPGNIRELENLIERTMNFCKTGLIELEDLPPFMEKCAGSSGNHFSGHEPAQKSIAEPHSASASLNDRRDEAEKKAIIEALQSCLGNKTRAAEKLGISRVWLYRKIKEYDLKK